jgi:hypothetical protein
MNKNHTLNALTLAICAAFSGSVIAQDSSTADADAKSKEKFEQIVVTAYKGMQRCKKLVFPSRETKTIS